MNVVILTGRLTAEPELRYTQQNVPCTSFNLAVDRASKGDDADFPTIVAWRETAEFACKYLYKGSRIVVRGEIRTRTSFFCMRKQTITLRKIPHGENGQSSFSRRRQQTTTLRKICFALG